MSIMDNILGKSPTLRALTVVVSGALGTHLPRPPHRAFKASWKYGEEKPELCSNTAADFSGQARSWGLKGGHNPPKSPRAWIPDPVALKGIWLPGRQPFFFPPSHGGYHNRYLSGYVITYRERESPADSEKSHQQ